MSSFELNIDPREAQYARFAGNILKVLRSAVGRRTADGVSRREICDRIDMDKSTLSRILNARIQNVTLRTVSDILWAAEHEPTELSADALEVISPNYCPLHRRSSSLTTTSNVPYFFHFDRHTDVKPCVMLGQASMQNVKLGVVEVSPA